MANFEAKQLLKDKKFWVASFLIAWAAALQVTLLFISQNFHHNVSSCVFQFSFWSFLQGHMMWLQRQDSFKQKFGTIDQGNDADEQKK